MESSGSITIKPDTTIKPFNVKEFTDNVVVNKDEWTVSGDGVFDTLMETATKHLRAQFDGQRIREEDYANMYLELYKANLQVALEAWTRGRLLAAQLALVEKQGETEDAKKNLYLRQIESFDESFLEKILKILMDSWGIGFSVAKDSFEAEGIPATMQKLTIDDLYNKFILPNLDKYKYPRPDAIVTEVQK